MEIKPVLILESSQNGLFLNESASIVKEDKFVLSGIFTEFDVKNRNERIYTKDKFLPHLNEMNHRIKTMAVYGEFDHPDNFDISLSRISHILESAVYNEEKNRIDGSIRLLNTHYGKEAKALIMDKCPIFVSSRAAGITESNGEVSIKKLFTYDAVADPGFASARMEMKSLNESLGFNESALFRVYDMSDESKINNLFEMNNNDHVTKEQMVEYTDYLKTEIAVVKEQIAVNAKVGSDPEQFERLLSYYESLHESHAKMVKYLDYLADSIQVLVSENTQLKEKTDKLVEHNDYLAEHLEKAINYTNYLAENLDKNIEYSEYIAENLGKNIEYSEYIAENLNKSIEYSEYLAENVDKNIEYAEYIAENLDKNIEYSEYIAEHVDHNIQYAEYLAEHVDNNIAYSEYIAENVSDAHAYSKYIAESLDKTIDRFSNNLIKEDVQTADQNIPDLKVTNVDKYYEDDVIEDEDLPTELDDVVEEEPAQFEEPIQSEETQIEEPIQVQEPLQDEEPVQVIDDVPAQVEEPIQVQEPVQAQTDVILLPGTVVEFETSAGEQSGEVLSYNPQDGYAIVKILGGEEDDVQAQEVQVHESQVTIKSDKVYETELKLKDSISKLILEAKKRKAAEEHQPHFLLFLTESNKKSWSELSLEDKEKVNIAMNKSVYTSEKDVLNIIKEALTEETKTSEEILIDAIPDDLVDIWNSLNDTVKKSVLAQAKFYPNLTTNESKMVSFWNSRSLEKFLANDGKTLINENKKFVDDTRLSEDVIDRYLNKFGRL